MSAKPCSFCGRETDRLTPGLCHACEERARRNGTPEYLTPLLSAEDSRAAFHANLDDPRHGTMNGYRNLRCRCDRCREANTEVGRKWRTDRPDLSEARRVRAKAARISGRIPGEMRQRFADERAELALRQAAEMEALINRQRAAAAAWVAENNVAPLRERLAREEEKIARLRAAAEFS